MNKRPKVLVVSNERLTERLAGPAIRALELARVLAATTEVTLGAPPGSQNTYDVPVVEFDTGDFKATTALYRTFDVAVIQSLPLALIRRLRKVGGPKLVFDMYDPMPLEALEFYQDRPTVEQQRYQDIMIDDMLGYCAIADFLICASEKQRDLFLGGMLASGLVDAASYAHDPTFRSVIDVVPFGMPSKKPRHNKNVLKGVWPGINERDQVIIWGGGVWDWFDPLTVVKAVERIKDTRVKLFFLGVKRPKAGVEVGKRTLQELLDYCDERGLTDTRVFFNHDWVPYDERHNYLLESDLGISAHYDHLETRYSFRTRLLDYWWVGLPAVSTKGDALADMVAAEKIGEAVEYEDADGMAEAIKKVLANPKQYREGVPEVAKRFTWERAGAPLVQYCADFTKRPERNRGAPLLTKLARRQYPRHLRSYAELHGGKALVTKALKKPWNKLRGK